MTPTRNDIGVYQAGCFFVYNLCVRACSVAIMVKSKLSGNTAPVSKTWSVVDFAFSDSYGWYDSSGLFSSFDVKCSDTPFVIRTSDEDGQTVTTEHCVHTGHVTFKKARRAWVLQLPERVSAVFHNKTVVPSKRYCAKRPEVPREWRQRTQQQSLEVLESDEMGVVKAEHMEAHNAGTVATLFELRHIVGEGTYASVWLARNKFATCGLPGSSVAIKIPKRAAVGCSADLINDVVSEFQGLMLFRNNKDFVQVSHCFACVEPFEAVVVMEYCSRSLAEALAQTPFLAKDPGARCQVAFGMASTRALLQIARGVAAMHAHNILHRDLKPGNMLVRSGCHGDDGCICISDFGDATTTTAAAEDARTVGTSWYRALELWLGGHATKSSDVWALSPMLNCRKLHVQAGCLLWCNVFAQAVLAQSWWGGA